MSLQTRLVRRIQRGEARLVKLHALSQRYSLTRMGVFFGGLGLGVLAWLVVSRTAAWGVLGLSALIFLAVAALHRRVENWITRFTLWSELQKDELARLELDWERLPGQPASAPRSALDIDLDLSGARSLLQILDLAISVEGSQLLTDWLAHPQPNPDEIAKRQQVVKELKRLPRFRQRLLLNLRLVSREQLHGARLLEWLDRQVPAKLKWLLIGGLCLSAINLILFILYIGQTLPAYWIFSFTASMAFYFFNVDSIKGFLEAVVALDSELEKFAVLLRYLESCRLPASPHLEALLAPYRTLEPPPSKRLRQFKLVTAGVGVRSNPVIGLLLNLFFPWDFLFALLAARLRASASAILPVWLQTLYPLEALVSLGGFAALHPTYTFPEIDPQAQPVFAAHALSHPLIPFAQSTPNDFSITSLGELAIITGSNMAGKSTFLKTVGINLCLAYAGGPVAGHRLRCRPFRLHTCMRISDSIADGFSYFYAEVRCLRSLLDEIRAEDERPLLYLIDEIFRGTNNRERLIGSRAYVQALLGAHGAGLIATHDLELASLAEADRRVNNYHFRDEVTAGRLVFDYQIRPGASPTTNALKIMELEGLPAGNSESG